MIEIKTSELIGPALDWAVAHATQAWMWAHEWFPTMTLDPTFRGVSDNAPDGHVNLVPSNPMRQGSQTFKPSTDWAQGGPLIENYRVEFTFERDGLIFAELCEADGSYTKLYTGTFGPNHLVAACRAIVAAKLGDTVSVPRELMQ